MSEDSTAVAESPSIESASRSNNPFAPFQDAIMQEIIRPAIAQTLANLENEGVRVTSNAQVHRRFLADHYSGGERVSASKFSEWLNLLGVGRKVVFSGLEDMFEDVDDDTSDDD